MLGKTLSRPSRFLLLPLLVCAALANGCKRDQPAPASTQTAETPVRGGTVVTGWPSEPGGINELIVPSSQTTNEMLFRVFLRLLEEQPDFRQHPPTFTPQLAESYEWSDDHKVLTFHLRKDAVWTDGVPITAEDVRWTWQAQVHPDVAWDSIDSKRFITDVEVVDPHTVRFHFSRVYSTQLLNANEGVILPKHAWGKLPFSQWRQKADWFRENLVSSGPFTIESWEPQQQLVLKRNERYYEKGLPYLDRVVMRIVSDQAARVTQVLSGDLDFVPQVGVSDVPRIKSNPQVELLDHWFNIFVAVGWNNEHPIFKDAEVRRAMTLGIDRATIVETLWGPYATVASSPILSQVWAHNPAVQPLPYNPGEARRLLAARGWKDTNGDGVLDRDGKPFAFELLVNASNQARVDSAVMIQDQLKKVGVSVEIRSLEFNTMVEQLMTGDFDAAYMGMTIDTSLDMTSLLHSNALPPEGSNQVHYRNPEVDRLIGLSMSQRDILEARPYLYQIQEIIQREQPMTFLWESDRLTVVNKRVKNFKPTAAFSFFNLKEWWIEP
jgi:peptide/nickel transport system substrate-binding protein